MRVKSDYWIDFYFDILLLILVINILKCRLLEGSEESHSLVMDPQWHNIALCSQTM